MPKNYSSIRVYNPTSECHLVPLNPEQDFYVSLLGISSVIVNGEFIDLDRQYENTLFFKQIRIPENISYQGNFYLGGIHINECVIAPILLTEIEQVKNTLVCLNPNNQKIKIHYNQTLKVVCSHLSEMEVYKYIITPNLGLDLLKIDRINSGDSRSLTKKYAECHFYFKPKVHYVPHVLLDVNLDKFCKCLYIKAHQIPQTNTNMCKKIKFKKKEVDLV